MFRSALDALDVLARLKERGVTLHMIDLGGDVTGNGISKLVFTILSAVAEAERDRTRERIADVKRDQSMGEQGHSVASEHSAAGKFESVLPLSTLRAPPWSATAAEGRKENTGAVCFNASNQAPNPSGNLM